MADVLNAGPQLGKTEAVDARQQLDFIFPTKSAHSLRRAALPPGDYLRRRACHISCPLFESLHHEDAHPTWNRAHLRACSKHSEMRLAQLIPLPGCRTTQPLCRNHKPQAAPTLARCHSPDRMHAPDAHQQTMQSSPSFKRTNPSTASEYQTTLQPSTVEKQFTKIVFPFVHALTVSPASFTIFAIIDKLRTPHCKKSAFAK